MNKKNKNVIIFSPKKSNKNILFGNLSPKMSDPALKIKNTLKRYIDKKLNEKSDKELFKKKAKKLKSFHGIIKRNNRENNYTTNLNSRDNIQLFSSLQNLSISIINSNNKNNEDYKLFKNATYKKGENPQKIFSYTKKNDNKKITNIKDNINKTNNKIKFNLSEKIPRIKVKNIFKKPNHSSSMKNIKIKNTENNMSKTNIKENKENNFSKTLFRFSSSDIKDFKNNNLYSERCTSIRQNLENNQLGLSQKISFNSTRIKINENKNNFGTPKKIKNTNIKKTNNKYKKNSKFHPKINKNNNNKSDKKNKKINNNKEEKKDTKCFNELKKINTDKINNNIKNNINEDSNNYYVPSLEKNESMNASSILNLHLNDQKHLDNYELCWNLKNDYSKDIDISLISINNQKKSIINNYKLSPNKFPYNFNDNNNINNIYLNNIQNVNNINNKQNDLSITNKQEYFSKLELLENENKLLKNEIKESKNRISILEYKIEELLDDKSSKENSECPQPTPYVIKYSKDIILPSKIKPKIEDQEHILKTSNEIIKEYSKNETKESDGSNRIISKNEEELKNG